MCKRTRHVKEAYSKRNYFYGVLDPQQNLNFSLFIFFICLFLALFCFVVVVVIFFQFPLGAMKYQTNGLGLLLFAALVTSAHKEKISEASYNDGGGKGLNISMQIVAFTSQLLYRKILLFYSVIDCLVSTTSVSAGLHQLLSENIGVTTGRKRFKPLPRAPTPLPLLLFPWLVGFHPKYRK